MGTPGLWMRIAAWIFGRQIIALRDKNSGRIYWTYKMRNPFGGYWAYVFPFEKVGCVVLNSDGSIPVHYCDQWVEWPSKIDSEVEALERMVKL